MGYCESSDRTFLGEARKRVTHADFETSRGIDPHTKFRDRTQKFRGGAANEWALKWVHRTFVRISLAARATSQDEIMCEPVLGGTKIPSADRCFLSRGCRSRGGEKRAPSILM
jgi:hypothetical protein